MATKSKAKQSKGQVTTNESPTATEPQEATTPVEMTPPQAPILSDIAGATPIRSRINQQSRVRINLYKPVAPGVTYVVECVEHGVIKHYGRQKTAKDTVYRPQAWCPGCAKIVEQRAVEAAEKAAAKEAKAAAPQAVETPA